MAFTPEQHREHRRQLKAQGICTRCHKRPTPADSSHCDTCREEYRDYYWLRSGDVVKRKRLRATARPQILERLCDLEAERQAILSELEQSL